MGQYHVLVNYDKKEVVEPYGLGLGAKQVEQLGAFKGTIADAMYLLVMTSPARGGGDLPLTGVSGRWAGDRVMIVGDYTEDSDVPSIPNVSKLYNGDYLDISNQVAEALQVAFGRNVRESSWHPDYVDKEETHA
jgi:hypothetical protein